MILDPRNVYDFHGESCKVSTGKVLRLRRSGGLNINVFTMSLCSVWTLLAGVQKGKYPEPSTQGKNSKLEMKKVDEQSTANAAPIVTYDCNLLKSQSLYTYVDMLFCENMKSVL